MVGGFLGTLDLVTNKGALIGQDTATSMSQRQIGRDLGCNWLNWCDVSRASQKPLCMVLPCFLVCVSVVVSRLPAKGIQLFLIALLWIWDFLLTRPIFPSYKLVSCGVLGLFVCLFCESLPP